MTPAPARPRRGGRELRGAHRNRDGDRSDGPVRAGIHAVGAVAARPRRLALPGHSCPARWQAPALLRDDRAGRRARPADRTPLIRWTGPPGWLIRWTGPPGWLIRWTGPPGWPRHAADSCSGPARGTAVTRLPLAWRPLPHQAAGTLPGLQPVAEIRLGDLPQQPDVRVEVRQQRLALLPGERLPAGRLLLQDALKRPGDGRCRRPRQVPPGGRDGPDRLGYRQMAERPLRVSGDILPRHLGDNPLRNAKEGADGVQRLGWRVDQRPVPEHQDVLPREQRVQLLQLLAVPAEPGVVPELGPASGDPAVFVRAGRDEVIDGVEPGRP